jgi:signal transduction histidine kinase
MINIDTLRQIPLFADLTDEQCQFLEWGKERWLEADEILAVEGEPSGYFWVLLEGEIQCTKRMGDRQVPWTSFGSQAYFGHELILLNEPYLATARATCVCHLLEFDTDEIEQSTQHISKIVQAAKDYTYLDRAPLQETDIHEGLENTLRILGHKLGTGITVIREYDTNLPPICLYGSELNQVWTHLIENAIEAMAGQGQIAIETSQVEDRILVEIIDNGPGIPSEVQPYIFEQFFTTKDMRQGTGLGLPIAYRVVVDRHQGQIFIDSEPGRTCFRVFLPMNLTELFPIA